MQYFYLAGKSLRKAGNEANIPSNTDYITTEPLSRDKRCELSVSWLDRKERDHEFSILKSTREHIRTLMPRLGNHLSLELDWNPVAFMQSQSPSCTSIGDAIVFCGPNVRKSVAMTVNEYCRKAFGEVVTDTLVLAVNNAIRGIKTQDLAFFTQQPLEIEFDLETINTGHTMIHLRHKPSAKIIEMLLWMSSACRQSSCTDEATTCQPLHIFDENLDLLKQKLIYNRVNSASKTEIGCQWLNLVGNPVIVKDYAVVLDRDREEEQKGLQVSKEVLLRLAPTDPTCYHFDIPFFGDDSAVLIPITLGIEQIEWRYVAGSICQYYRAVYPAVVGYKLETKYPGLESTMHFISEWLDWESDGMSISAREIAARL